MLLRAVQDGIYFSSKYGLSKKTYSTAVRTLTDLLLSYEPKMMDGNEGRTRSVDLQSQTVCRYTTRNEFLGVDLNLVKFI